MLYYKKKKRTSYIKHKNGDMLQLAYPHFYFVF